jgi:hypothetical protein
MVADSHMDARRIHNGYVPDKVGLLKLKDSVAHG